MISEKADFQAKIIAKHKEEHYGICQENVTILDTYVPNSKPERRKRQIYNYSWRVSVSKLAELSDRKSLYRIERCD